MQQLLLLPLCTSLLIHGASAATNALYRINAGGPAYTDSEGNEWEASSLTGYNAGGNSHSEGSAIISNTSDPTLYRSELWAAMTWSFPIAEQGEYEVRLHYAEVYGLVTGQRVFDVKVNNDLVLDNFDIYAAASGGNTAWVETLPVTMESGSILTIEFIRGEQQPKVCAIEILPVSSSPDFSLYINTGGNEHVDSQGNTWEVDTPYLVSGGIPYTLPGVAIANTEEDMLYRSERYRPMTFEMEVPNGDYQVTLHWAEVRF